MIGSSGASGKFGAATTFAQLLFANGPNQAESTLQPGGQTTTFRTGFTAGRLWTIYDTIQGLIPDEAAATFELVVWDNSSGLYSTWTQASVAWDEGLIAAGKSGAFTLEEIGGPVNVAPNMLPETFNLYYTVIPEPSSFALAALALMCMLPLRQGRASAP